MNDESPATPETDDRFPSGKWLGFFLMTPIPGRHQMELLLTFQNGIMTGAGRDWVGEFLIRGQYDVQGGQCHWLKQYIGKHHVFYRGFNESRGIWGVWEIRQNGFANRGGFHIWPEGMADPTNAHLTEENPLPRSITFDDEESSLGSEVLTPLPQESEIIRICRRFAASSAPKESKHRCCQRRCCFS